MAARSSQDATEPGLGSAADHQDRDKGNWHFDGNKINVVAFKMVAKARRENTNSQPKTFNYLVTMATNI